MKLRGLRRQHASGIAGLVVVVLTIWFCLALYAQHFRSVVPVTVMAPRSGLLMEAGADVKFHGVVVGQVSSVDANGAGAELILELDPVQVDRIPADMRIAIVPPTAFGAKYVEIHAGPDPDAAAVTAGAVIDGARVTVEVNQTFEAAHQALGRLDPARLNAALAATSEFLQGQGVPIGQLIQDSDRLAARLADQVPALARDVRAADRVAKAYEPVVDDLVATADGAAAVLINLVQHEAELYSALTSAISVSDHLSGFLSDNEVALRDLTSVLIPTTALLRRYSPSLECTLLGVAHNDKLLSAIMGGPDFGGTHRNAHVTFIAQRGLSPYTYPANLPVVGANSGPNCAGLPYVHGLPPYFNHNTGANPYREGQDGIDIGDVPIGLILFGAQYPDDQEQNR